MPPPPSPGAAPSSPTRPSRRAVLGAVAGTSLAGTAGCVRQVRALLNRDRPSQVSLSIETVPADADPRAMLVAQFLRKQLEAVGIAVTVVPTSRENLYRDVLVNQQFDLYVGRMPGWNDPDFLRGLLHSRFAPEPGWQNPFGYVDLGVDRFLERQRRQAGAPRRRTLAHLQREIVRSQPFTVVAFPDEIRAVGSDGVTGWNRNIHTPLGYLAISTGDGSGSAGTSPDGAGGPSGTPTEPSSGGAGSPVPTGGRTPTPTDASGGTPAPTPSPTPDNGGEPDGVRMALTDTRALENLNPLAVPYRNEGTITGLLYDPLGRSVGGRIRPWLAESWDWQPAPGNRNTPGEGGTTGKGGTPGTRGTPEDSSTGGGPTLVVELREDLAWHDGTPITADDVAFTYRFLEDTSLGNLDSRVPAPRFRGRASLVTGREVLDERTVRLRFRESSRVVAGRALTVPLLPAHVWTEKAREVTVAGIDLGGRAVTEALVWANRRPVGSGPVRVGDFRVRETLSLEPFDGHFLASAEDPHLRPFRGGFGPDGLIFQRAPSSGAAISMVQRGDADATATDVIPGTVPTIGRNDDVELHVSPSTGFYHLGYNTRTTPLGNPRFRRAVARLLDRRHLVETVFDGYAAPAISPLERHEAVAPDLAWTDGTTGPGSAPVLPFPGENGRLDVRRARRAFAEAGYRYTDDGRLVTS